MTLTPITFPQKIKDRETFIFDQILSCNFEAMWSEISYVAEGKQVKLFVMEDALMVGGVRVNVSATLEQKIADVFDASLPTALVADLMYAFAVRRANPSPRPISSTVDAMIAHSNAVGKQFQQNVGIAATVGKHWILDKKLEFKTRAACNYGWHFTGSSFQGISGFPAATKFAGKNVKIIQPNATAHDAQHSDYSQICQLVSQSCWVNGTEYRFSDLLKDQKLAPLVSHMGVLKNDRQPGTIIYTDKKITLPTRLPTIACT